MHVGVVCLTLAAKYEEAQFTAAVAAQASALVARHDGVGGKTTCLNLPAPHEPRPTDALEQSHPPLLRRACSLRATQGSSLTCSLASSCGRSNVWATAATA